MDIVMDIVKEIVVPIVSTAIGSGAVCLGLTKALKEGLRCLLRSKIKDIYYSNLEKKTLREYERQDLDHMYEAYAGPLHGNSFVADIYKEMRTWEVTK